jgi:hypothetical protein
MRRKSNDEFATAYRAQVRSLSLRPWELPPCCVTETSSRSREERQASALLRRMIDAGLSKFCPNPREALEAIAAEEPDRKPRERPRGGESRTTV